MLWILWGAERLLTFDLAGHSVCFCAMPSLGLLDVRSGRLQGQSPAGNPSDIYLMVERSTACQPGAEVSIDYGDKSNEELLLLYGEEPFSSLSESSQ